LRLRLSADYERLEFLRVLRSRPAEPIGGDAVLIGPLLPDAVSAAPVAEVQSDG